MTTTTTRTYRDTGRAKSPGSDFVLLLLLAPLLMLLSGWGIATVWGWFIPPVTGWPPIGVWHGYGLAVLGGLLHYHKSDSTLDPIAYAGSVLISVPLLVGFAWIAHALAF